MHLKGISAAPIVARPLEERAQMNKGRLISGRAEKLPVTFSWTSLILLPLIPLVGLVV
jgi:hypothetical protein